VGLIANAAGKMVCNVILHVGDIDLLARFHRERGDATICNSARLCVTPTHEEREEENKSIMSDCLDHTATEVGQQGATDYRCAQTTKDP
jgi:hypothetical protein